MTPWKYFLMGWMRKIQKHKEERDRSRKFIKIKRKQWKGKKRFLCTWRFPYLCVFHWSKMPSSYLPSCDLPSSKPTCMGTSPTT
jgi:hypothetical protein